MLRVDPRFIIPALLLCACTAADEPQTPDADPVVAGIQEQIAADSTNWELHAQLAGELRRKDRLEEAGVAAEKAFALAPEPAIEARLEMAKVHAAADRSAAAINLVKDAERRKRAGEVVDEVKIAEVYAVLGDTAAVFRWLDRAALAGTPSVATLQSNPDLAGMHDHPRWAEIVGPAGGQ